MSDLYSEFLVKKEPTTKDAVIKYGMIILTAVAAAAGLLFSFVFLLAAVVLGVACYFIVPRTDLEYEYLFVNGEMKTDGPTWDCAAVSLRAIDQNGNLLPYCGEAVQLSVEGPVKILGPAIVPLRGGMAGTYLATTGEAGRAVLHCRMEGALDVEAALTVRKRSGTENAN